MTGPGGVDRVDGSDTITTVRPDRVADTRAHDTGVDRQGRRGWQSWREHSAAPLLFGFGAYLVLSVVLWWSVWSSHPTTVTTCGCGDASLFTWFLEWPAYALAHGHNPLYSTAMFHPGGVNLLDNTSELAVGIVLAPVTWLFGPVATLNVVSTLALALSALTMFWLVRRWVSWTPAAFVAGLCYGFSSFVLYALIGAHLMNAVLVIPPLMVACLDELLVRQRRRPVAVGVVLAVLVVLQFFVGTEMLIITVLTAAVGIVVVTLYAAVRDGADLRRRARHACVGLGAAAVVGAVLLAYPVWFALDGPAHLSGLIWPTVSPGVGGTSLANYWHLTFDPASVVDAQRRVGGYQGPGMPDPTYLGIGLLVVLAAGVVIWHRDRRLWFFGVVGLASVALSLSIANTYWVPWRVLVHIPMVKNVMPSRFTAMTVLCAAVMLGIVVDRTHTTVTRWVQSVGARTGHGTAGSTEHSAPAGVGVRATAAAAALAVVLVALVPLITSFIGKVPLTATPVVVPRWFTEVAPHLPSGQVVLAIPASSSGLQSDLSWQAIDGMHYAIPDGGGPQGIAARAGSARQGFTMIGAASFSFGPAPTATASTIDAVRHALAVWGVTTIVVPDQPGLPVYEQDNHVASAVGLLTAAVGRAPRHQADAWVWDGVKVLDTPVSISPQAFQTCVGVSSRASISPEAVPNCVLAAAELQR